MTVKKEILFEKRGLRFLIRMEDSTDPDFYRSYEELRYKIWGDPDDRLAGSRNLACENYLDKGGSLFISVLKEEGGSFDGPDALVGQPRPSGIEEPGTSTVPVAYSRGKTLVRLDWA